MQIPVQKLKEMIVGENFISDANFDILAEEAARLGHNVSDVLVFKNIV